MNKNVINQSVLSFTPDFPGLKGVTISARQFPIEPFLVFTEFRMDQPVFGPHPHAGISVMTYMLPDSLGSFINRDSLGDFSTIEPGGLHITQAGSGVHHDEFPKTSGLETHGFQIWINHTEKNRWVPPKSMHATADEIPEVKTAFYKVRVLHGSFGHQKAPHTLVTSVTLLHVFLQPQHTIEFPTASMAFVYGLNGQGSSNGYSISGQTLLNYDTIGDRVVIEAGADGMEFMLGTGIPLNEPIVYGGPFVMTTQQQMTSTQARYTEGSMGTLSYYKG